MLRAASLVLLLLATGSYQEQPAPGVHQPPPAPEMAAATFVMLKRDEWSASPPFHGGLLPHFSQYGAIDVHEQSISLGRGQPGQSGALWSKTPCPYTEWSFTTRLSIRGGEVEGGAGLAFWYTLDGHATGPVLGGPDKWRGLGLLLDTYDDDHRGNNPAILAIMNDGSFEYKPHSDGEGQYFAGCLRNLRNRAHPISLRVSHIRQLLKVEVDDEGEGRNWVVCFEKHGISLPAGSYFGITASTNDHPDEMELLDFSLSSVKVESEKPIVTGETRSRDQPPTEQPQHHYQQQPSSASPVSTGPLFNAEELGKLVEAAVQRQLLNWQGDASRRLQSVEDMIHSIMGTINGMGKSLHGLEDHVHQQLQQLEAKTSATSPGHQELQSLLGELRSRLEILYREHEHGHGHGHGHEHGMSGAAMANSNKYYSSRWWIWFLVMQALMLALFLLVKLKVDRREKKLI